jgi:hypothetical protein
MTKLFEKFFYTTVALTVLSYGTAIALSVQPDPNPQQIQIINSLTQTAQSGSTSIFRLLGADLLWDLLSADEDEKI